MVLIKGQSGTQIAGSAQRLGNVPGVAAVARPTQLAGGSYRIDVMLKRGADVGQFTSRARALSLPGETSVGGISVSFADQRSAIADRAPLVAAVIALVVLGLLFFGTGSAILPLKALVMTGLTVMGALGVMVAIFQNGWFEGALNYTSTGTFDLTVPVLVGAFGAALSIDYSIILLARIRESRAETGGDDREAIALGLDRTGRVVSASAALFCVAFLAFALVRLTLIKEIGIGTAAAVVIDVTLVRALLVPALMALLGRANWWAPGALRRRLRD
ncbi:MAG TPA: MMPL family transporter [Baekduia sp.]|nr:MMPL family transporter [Baekduia sp.]